MSTYSQLKADVASWLQRSNLTAQIASFIRLAEARIGRELRLRDQLTFTTLSLSAGTVALPDDFLEFKALVYADDATPLRIGTVEQVMADRARISGYRPKFCTVTGSNLYLGPIADSTYSVNAAYYARYSALSADAETNWLLTNHPSLYLWAALAEAAPWMQNDARAATWEAKYQADKSQLQASDKAAEYSGTGLEVSPLHTHEVV